MPQKGRKVPSLQLGERKQYPPGQLRDSINPVVQKNIEQLALAGYERDGRGALLVELDDTAKHGVRSAQYFSVAELADIGRAVPNVEAKPISEVVATYDPNQEFVAMIMNVTPTLPGPQLWFEIFPCTP